MAIAGAASSGCRSPDLYRKLPYLLSLPLSVMMKWQKVNNINEQ
ncbi:hypothetical protein ECEPECA12_3495 [Escherichia coli EPECa12]|nr:hypothetical protein ECEPECA12_3495 [Escherichia coli EPECa12]